MKYEVVNITQQYKEGNINATEAMNTIVSYIFPEITQDISYVKRLIAFMWDVEPSLLHTTGSITPNVSYARTMYTKILKEKNKSTNTRVAEMIGATPNAVLHRLRAHDGFIASYDKYKKIYNIISKVL